LLPVIDLLVTSTLFDVISIVALFLVIANVILLRSKNKVIRQNPVDVCNSASAPLMIEPRMIEPRMMLMQAAETKSECRRRRSRHPTRRGRSSQPAGIQQLSLSGMEDFHKKSLFHIRIVS